jgi:hypothetical protein
MSGRSSAAEETPVRFRAFPQFNQPGLAEVAGSKSRLSASTLRHFASERMADRLARALGEVGGFPIKELVESFEFFERVRSSLRVPVVADLMCGHGLVGALFAVFEPKVEQVLLVDHRRPSNHDALLEGLGRVASWAPSRLRYLEGTLEVCAAEPIGAVVAVHACGQRTDACLDLALERGAQVAVMPCCYGPPREASPALMAGLGPELATDVARTYRLEKAGYRVRWRAIPPEITPMGRILLAQNPSPLQNGSSSV